MPTANADSTSTPQATPVTIAVLANDDGAGLMVTGYTEPGAGSLALNPDGSFTYTPVAGFSGSDGFTYTVRDAAGATATAMVTVTVARPNAPPRAEADTAQVTAGGSIVLPVLANDVDPDDDQLTLLLVEAPGHGTVQVEPGGDRLRYTPQAGFVGTDSFTYTVGDGQGGLATGSVTVAVTTASTPPAPVPDRVVTGVGEAVTVDVLANDQDPEGEPLSLTGVTMPAHGTLALTAEQRFVYTPEPGFEGEDGFTYTVRDSAGLRATGTVALLVERRNTPPVANPDSAVSVGGVPVRLDLLANDNDPEGDPLRLTALELPAGGQITVNPDQSVTYTPKTGFSGTDRFTYTVGDGAAEATVEAVVEVLPAAGVTFANGYRYRRRLVLPAAVAGETTVEDVVLLVRESGDWLRASTAGGRVENASGFDLRFELPDSSKLDHELERYDGEAGELVAWVRVPRWRLEGALDLLLYYGKPGLAASEAKPFSTWRGYLAVWDPRTGADRTGRGRNLTPANVAAGELIAGCGRFDGAAVASRADAGFLAGLGALTVQAVVRAEAPMLGRGHGVLAQGPMTGDPAAAGLGLSYLARSPQGAERVVAFALRCADGDLLAVSAPGAHGQEPQVLHATWARGAAPLVFVDGVAGPQGGPVRAGATALPAGGLHLGAGPGDPPTGGWQGLIDAVRVRAEALPAAWIALEGINLLRPGASYGLGGEDAAVDALAAPVALPVAVRVAVGDHVDLDPLASALDPDGHGLALVAFDQPADGRATVVDGRVRYSPRAGFTGRDSFAYTVSGGGKRSTGLITVTVTPPTIQAVDDTASTMAGAAVAVDVLANDAGRDLGLLAVEDPAHGTAAITGGSITYRPDPGFTGSDSFAYRVGNAQGEGRATVTVTVTDENPNLPYAYTHKPAPDLLPASDGDVVVWNVPAAGGTCPHVGNADQVLLMVAPSGPVRGAVSATNLQFKAVFLIGATLRPQGITSLMTQNGTWVRGGDMLRIGFAAGIAVRPVLFLANIDVDARNATEPNLFGGFLQAGTSRPAAGPADPDGSANAARWVDVHLEKIRVAHGSYSFAASGSAASAFFQPRTGGVGDVRCGQLDLRWHGAAFSMAGLPSPRDTVRPDARLFLNRVALRAMPPGPATADPLPAPVLFHLAGGAAEEALAQLERGNHQAVLFDEVRIERYAADGGDLEPYFVPSAAPDGGSLRFDSARQRIGFPAYRAPGRLHPAWTGEVAVAAAGAPAVVSDGEVGAAVRVTTVAKLREILMPRPDLRAVDDQVATSRGEAVTIDLLGNDAGAEGATVTLAAPARGTVSLTADNRARYNPPAGFTGSDSFAYTVTRGTRSSTATVRVDVSGQSVGAWGAGPRSGDRWWSGFGDVTAGSLGMVASFERVRNRPVDIIASWAPKNQIQSWDDIAGGPGDDASRITGTLTLGVNNKRVIWDNAATRALPVHLNLTLVPPSASNRNGSNPGVWWDYAAGQFDVYWRRLGRRMAFLDDLVDRTAPLVLDLGWEHSGPWYHWSIAGSRGGTPAYTQFPYAFARIVAAIREGYYAHARKNCPYKFCWRPARVAAAAGVHHAAFYPGDEAVDLIGMSHHERDPYLTPTNWRSRTSTWPAGRSGFTREGWDPFFDFCANRGKQACFPEWGPIEHHPEYEASPHPEEFFRLTRSYIEARLPLFAYECYFNGDEAKLTANAGWGGTREYQQLWGRPRG